MTNTRPLGKLSDFVVQLMALCLADPAGDFLIICKNLLDGLSEDCFAKIQSEEERAIALLDLKMLESAFVHSNWAAPEKLTQLIDKLSGPEIPMLTYEELVGTNPKGDLRLFTTGAIGDTERMFYEAHRNTESNLARAISKMRTAIGILIESGENGGEVMLRNVSETLTQSTESLSPMLLTMRNLGMMPLGHFDTFRGFFNPHPIRGLKGPSGAFSARFYTFDLLLRGNLLPEEYIEYIDTNRPYYSKAGRDGVDEAFELREGGNTLADLCKKYNDPTEIRPHIDRLIKFMDAFRKMHKLAVAKQIPAALSGSITGTGGEVNVRDFLTRRIGMEKPANNEKN